MSSAVLEPRPETSKDPSAAKDSMTSTVAIGPASNINKTTVLISSTSTVVSQNQEMSSTTSSSATLGGSAFQPVVPQSQRPVSPASPPLPSSELNRNNNTVYDSDALRTAKATSAAAAVAARSSRHHRTQNRSTQSRSGSSSDEEKENHQQRRRKSGHSHSSSEVSSPESNRRKQDLKKGLVDMANSSDAKNSDEEPLHQEDEEDDEDLTEDEKRDKRLFSWPAHLSEERRQLIGTEEESSERPSSDDDEEGNKSTGERGGGHASSSPWNITREQLNYYTTQFFSMQSNPRGVVPGHEAKEFFEKSRLPITELRRIWQLSDINKDGCLSLEEFLVAMHLVVLRRNDISLPEEGSELPAALNPALLRKRIFGDEADSKVKDSDKGNADLEGSETERDEGEESLLSASDNEIQQYRKNKMALVNQSGNETASSIDGGASACPGSGPANFDFPSSANGVRRHNPNIIQPVARRLSPESPVIGTSDDEGKEQLVPRPGAVKQGRREVVYEQLWNQEDVSLTSGAEESLSSMTLQAGPPTSTLTTSNTAQALSPDEDPTDEEELEDDDEEDISEFDVRGTTSNKSKNSSNNSHQSKHSFSEALERLQPAPPPSHPPPVRPANVTPSSHHARSSSLDLNNQHHKGQAPAVPPRNDLKQGHSIASTSSSSNQESKNLQVNIHRTRERNSMIARTINELHQEVSDALEERIALEFRLEQLKSFGD